MTQITRDQLRRELLQLTPDELNEFERRAFPQQQPEAPSSVLGNVFPEPDTDPTGMSLGSSQGLLATLSNVPFSLAERGRELETVVRSPLEAAKGIGRLVVGAGDLAAQKMFNTDPTENSQLAEQAIEGFKQDFTEEGFMRDPTAAITNVLPFVPIKGTGVLSKVARIAQDPAQAAVSPIVRATGRAVGRGARKVGRTTADMAASLGEIVAEVPGFTTGVGATPIIEAFKAGFEGNLDPFLRTVRDQTSRRDIAVRLRNRLKELKDEVGAEKRAFVEQNGSLELDVADLRRELDEILAEQGIQVIRRPDRIEVELPERLEAVGAERRPVEIAINAIERLGDRTTLAQLDDAKGVMDAVFRQGKESGAITTRMRKALRAKLAEVDGFNEVSDPVADINSFLDALEKDVNLRLGEGRFNPKSAGKALERGLDEGADDEFQALAGESGVLLPSGERVPNLEQRTGIPLRAELSGQRLSRRVPVGLVGRSQAAEGARTALLALTGGGVATGVLPAIPTVLGTVALFSPKVVGQVASRLGAGARNMKQITESVTALQKAALELGLPKTVTIAQLVERIQNNNEEEETPSSFLGTLGRAPRR